MADRPWRVTFVLTHPSQYMAPWFRHMASARDDLVLTVLYGTRPTPAAQAAGFGGAFEWDVPLLEGYVSTVLAPELAASDLHADRFSRVDVPRLDDALVATRPDAVVVPGWHAAIYLRALRACRARGIPAIYRGDSTLDSGPGGWRRPLWRLHTRHRLHRYDAWLAVGTRVREYLAEFRVPEPLVFHSPHAVDNDRFIAAAASAREPEARARTRAAFGIAPDARVVLYAGRLVSQKRPCDLIYAAARTARPVHLLFAGAGDQEAACRGLARELGVAASFAGFLNQTRMPEAYAAADCLALPSDSDTWGLVVNEALASGVPCIVSDGVGCAPDLIDGELTGRVVPRGDTGAWAAALDAILGVANGGAPVAEACRARADRHSFTRATDGLVAACARLERRVQAARENTTAQSRILACCGNMVIPGGLERMTFEVLQVCRDQGSVLHCIVNGWESSRIVSLAEARGASWTTGFYRHRFERAFHRPTVARRMLWDMLRTSAGLLCDAWRFRPTAVLLPDEGAVLRNWPGLLVLRLAGVRLVQRLGVAPPPGAYYRRLWRYAIAPLPHLLLCNSEFTQRELLAHGVPARKVRLARNVLPGRCAASTRPRQPGRLIFVGQIIPVKGVHLLLDALALLRARGHDASLDIVGQIDGWEAPPDAGYRASLVARAQDEDLQGHVRFLGWRDDVPELLAAASVHCCPSLPRQREAFGIVNLEAKAAGTPSVVSQSGALPDLVAHAVDGWVMRDDTAEALAEGCAYFLEAGERWACASAAARRSLDTFSHGEFAEVWCTALGVARVACAEGSARPC
jgi:glycosyltransferase involved in cell wall biosynthesis